MRAITNINIIDFINSKAFEGIRIGDQKEKLTDYLENKNYRCIYNKGFTLFKVHNVEFIVANDNKIILIHIELSELDYY